MSYFQENEISPFLIIQERSYSNAIFSGRNLFRSFGKKICFFCAVSCKSSAIDAVLRVLLIIELLSDLGKLFQETNPLGELISGSDLYVEDT